MKETLKLLLVVVIRLHLSNPVECSDTGTEKNSILGNFQVVSPFSKHGEIYTVDAEACNAGIPYADSFFVSNHWCLTRESATETRLSVWSQVKYKKNVWGFMKGKCLPIILFLWKMNKETKGDDVLE